MFESQLRGPTIDYCIEYVDGLWLHVHHSGGMTSLKMDLGEINTFIGFLKKVEHYKKLYSRGDCKFYDLPRHGESENFTYQAEYHSDDRVVLDIGCRDMLVCFPVLNEELGKFIQCLKNDYEEAKDANLHE